MFCAGGHNIDSCCVDAAVSQNIGQFGDLFLNTVKSPGKQLAQIVGKHLAGFYSGCLAEGFHLRPNIAPVQRLPVPGNKDRSRTDAVFLCVMELIELAAYPFSIRYFLQAIIRSFVTAC